jgi:micrococcal nuclease
VTVTRVVDGDTFDVRFANGSTDTVRLLGVDTPEVYGENDPTEFEGVPDTEAGRACLRSAGEAASEALRERLAGGEATLVRDPVSDGRGDFGRLLAYVEVNGTDVTRWLLEAGYARVYDSTFSRSEDYYAVESAAQEAGTGLWTCRTPESTGGLERTATATESGLRVADVHYDAAGNDNENLNDEYVVFENVGDETLILGGWTVRDEADHTYEFPEGFELGPGELVTLYTGSGDDTPTSLYWGRTGAVWNNGGDTVTLVDDSGATVLERSY